MSCMGPASPPAWTKSCHPIFREKEMEPMAGPLGPASHFVPTRSLSWSCSEASSLASPLQRGLITDQSWSEAPSITNPLPRGVITDWTWSETLSSQILYYKCSLQNGAGRLLKRRRESPTTILPMLYWDQMRKMLHHKL